MTRVYLVRHGRAAAGWEDLDPALDELGEPSGRSCRRSSRSARPARAGHEPAAAVPADRGAAGERWGTEARIEPMVAEIPTPVGVAVADRVDWLRVAMQQTWSMLGPRYVEYRDHVVAMLLGCTADTVVTSHFVAINAVIGAATGDDRLVIRRLDNCSITVFDVRDGLVALVEGGHEADTLIR